MPDENKKHLVEMLAKKEIPLIEDDIYGEMYFGKNRPKTCKTYDKKGLVLHCSSFSKSLAPGYRIGWVIPGKFKEQIIRLKRMHTVATNTLSQAAIAHFLSNGRYELHIFGIYGKHCTRNRCDTFRRSPSISLTIQK